MKKGISVLLCSLLIMMSFAGCKSAEENKKTELTVFAAASMTETLTKIAENYEKDHENISLVFNFDSSGTLKTQIEEGAECDLFISAAQKQMNQLDITGDESFNPDRLDFIDADTRKNLLENKVVLVVPEGNPKEIQSFEDLAKRLPEGDILMAMGNEDVPVGQYTKEILEYFDLDETALAKEGCITYGSNVKEVTSQVSEAAVDCGVIYATDACSAGLTAVDEAKADMCSQIIYPAAVLKHSKASEEAKAFLAYLSGEEATKIFEEVGFNPAGK